MKILYLLFSFTTGGTERLVTDICNEMVNRDHDIHLYVVNDRYDQNMLAGLDSRVRVQLQKRQPGGGGKLETLRLVADYIRKNGIEAVHCNSLAAPELLLLKPLCYPGVKILHTIHDVGQYKTLGRVKVTLRNLLCSRFIAISDCVNRDIVANGADARKVVTVYNAIDLTRFRPAEKRREHDGIRIGNVARIMPEKKGQDVLIRAIARLKDFYPQLHCYFAGEADDAHQPHLAQLKALAQELGVGDRVTFLGNVKDVPGFLESLDVFVLPSRYEGFGISLLEAMAMGVPCIASHLDGPAEIIQNGTYGELFPCGDDAALAGKLDALLQDRTGAAKRADRAKEMVRSHFDIRKMCDQLTTLYLS